MVLSDSEEIAEAQKTGGRSKAKREEVGKASGVATDEG